MDNWIEEKIICLKQEYVKFNEDEIALRGYVGTIIRLLNGLAEINYTQFHIYQKQILGKSMELFCEYCLEQIQEAYKCNDVLQKKKYIDDIEKAISEIIMVYRELVAGIGHVNRRVFQSLPLEDNVYEISPKICAFYSYILEQLDNLFEEKRSYAFIPHYTLQSVTESKILFGERKKTGKIVVIYIPGGIFEKIDVTTVCLIHEAFHVLSRRSRLRKERALCFVGQMLLHVKQQLFKNVKFSGENDENIKQDLMTFWFGEIYNEAYSYKNKAWDSKEFYGDIIKKEITQKIYEALIQVNGSLNESIIQTATNYVKVSNYETYKKVYNETKQIIESIRKNLLRMIFDNNVAKVSELFMKIFHEVYADIACVLTCDLEFQKYENAFNKSILFSYKKNTFDDINRVLRMRLVAESVENFVTDKVRESWKEKLKSMPHPVQSNSIKRGVSDGQNLSEYVNIILSNQMYELFADYAIRCANALKEELKELSKAQEFCSFMKRIIALPSEQLLAEVLIGNIVKLGE